MAFGTTYEGVKQVTSQVRKVLDKPLIVKLTPNVTSIQEPARGAEDARSRRNITNKHTTRDSIDINTKNHT